MQSILRAIFKLFLWFIVFEVFYYYWSGGDFDLYKFSNLKSPMAFVIDESLKIYRQIELDHFTLFFSTFTTLAVTMVLFKFCFFVLGIVLSLFFECLFHLFLISALISIVHQVIHLLYPMQ